MRIKGILILTTVLLSTIITFYGCIDEPEIAHPNRPYGSIRFGNFTTNVDSMEITIFPGPSDSLMGNYTSVKLVLGANTLLDYIDRLAGKKNISVKNIKTGTEVFKGEIEIPGLKLNSFYFLGMYSADTDSNSFMFTQIEEGLTYVSHAPAEGTINLYFLYLAVEPKALGAIPYTVDLVDLSPEKDTLVAATLQHIRMDDARIGINYGNVKPGKRQFAATKEFDMKTIYVKDADTTNYTANKNWYFIVSGDKSKLNYKVAGFNPPAVKGK
ncbi:MAG: hypothetical protein HYV28_06555 [Ignavibacteriales bacterium]|nr:hypothetical protein [Ignavibacteriales bacterium]